MTFDDIPAQVVDLLRRQGRVSYRALKRRFDLDDDYLEDLKAELIDAQYLAVDEERKVLVWSGGPATTGVSASELGRAPLPYTPTYLSEKILTSKTALEGERKQVTVLFADLKGSMELLADRDPEKARQLLDPVLTLMMTAVHRYEGTVNQVMGDGIMALFGAPIAHEDHAVRACYAALAMQEAIRRHREAVRRSHGSELQIRVGLNSGAVVVGTIGSDLRMDYTAVGQTTSLAARMEQLAQPGSIWLTAETLRLVKGFVQVKPLGSVPIKGLTGPEEVFELIGAGPSRTRLQAAAARILTPFVGRQLEFDMLRQSLELARAGHGQIAAVIGEPGVGKSRLFHEFIRSHHTQGWLVLEAGAVSSYGKATPYLPVIDLLKAYFQVEGPDDGRGLRERVADKLLVLDETLRPSLPAFLMLLDVPVEDPQWQALDPPQRRRRTLDARKRLLLRESRAQPLLVILDSLQWIDTETQVFLDSVIESLPTARLLLLVNYRPEYQHGWASKTYYTQLRLDPLPPVRAEEFLRAILGNDASLQPLKQRLIERTEGNPFFLEESVRTMVETGVLVGELGASRLAKAISSIQVPASVQVLLAARIDRLPAEEKHLLQTGAVIGTEVPLPLLQAIAELPEATLHHGLASLQAAEFLYETRLFPDHAYTFKHVLTHEVAYGSLLLERRRALHARIVETLKALTGDRVAEQVEQLAHHALQGEVWDKALAYCRQAGEKAVARSAYREAIGYIEQALGTLSHLPETCDTYEQAIDLRLALRSALLPLGALGRILEALREAEAIAADRNDQRRLGQVSVFLSVHFRRMGAHDQALAAGQHALALATAGRDAVLHALANERLGTAYQAQGDYRRAIDCFRQTVASLEGARRHERFGQAFLPAVHSRAHLASCHAELGTFAEGRALGDEGLRIAEAAAYSASLMIASWGIGLLALRQGDLSRACSRLEGAMGICQEAEMPASFPLIAVALGDAYTLGGRVADSLPLLTQAMEQATVRERGDLQVRCRLSLSEAHQLAGRLEEAHTLAKHALALAREHHERGHQAYALHLLGAIAARRHPSDVEQAEGHHRQAFVLAEELGMRPLQAHCHLGLGNLYLTTDRVTQARTELSAALKLYRAMDMTFWLPQTEVALAQAEGP